MVSRLPTVDSREHSGLDRLLGAIRLAFGVIQIDRGVALYVVKASLLFQSLSVFLLDYLSISSSISRQLLIALATLLLMSFIQG